MRQLSHGKHTQGRNPVGEFRGEISVFGTRINLFRVSKCLQSEMIVKDPDKHKTIICPSQQSVKYKVVNLQRISQKQQNKKVQNLKAPNRKHTWQREKKHPQGQIQTLS